MKLHLIFARAANGVIGKEGVLPWHLPEDLAHFKRTTLGQPVIMGRKTWDSLPARFRPLPGRTNIVITRHSQWQADGATRAGSLAQAAALGLTQTDAWVIGGAEIFQQALPLAASAVVTELDAEFAGDVYAPIFGPGWKEIARQAHTSSTGAGFSLVTYRNTEI